MSTVPASIPKAIHHATEAGKLRRYVRQHGGSGLDGLLKLADRHSAAATAELRRTVDEF